MILKFYLIDSKKKRKIFCSLIILSFLISGVNCKNSPTSPDIEEIEYYDYELIYQRPEIVNYDFAWEPDFATLEVKGLYTWTIALKQVNKYKFIGEIKNLPIHIKGDYKLNSIYIVDPKRWEEVYTEPSGKTWGKPHSVGDVIILRNKQTGFVKKLEHIVPNPDFPSQYEPKMAVFRTIKGGIIKDY
ncbi:hypothetical protein NLC26_01855 [Candidatus Aminicenantes bacterium AC-708-M15]|nr:hypothetical protein [Candidatus Aminicenantes bacterium AC-708-M15]MCP2606367.1 hypothetical protein [Candidatus Aminicenantes bacterium AC-708-I09]MCP2618619.1 hypothetical protein [Candidatus Aminicenantes bacterium AC-335-A11]MCP2620980.1 hypothetical protein [Candidatus Aminicenantes bacterium AC-334-E05]